MAAPILMLGTNISVAGGVVEICVAQFHRQIGDDALLDDAATKLHSTIDICDIKIFF